jgi:peptide deformylase
MALLQIVRMGDPVLRRAAAAVEDPADPGVASLAQAMIETMIAAPGVGLAAPQVGRSLRLIVMRIVADRRAAADAPEPDRIAALINPELEPLDGQNELGWEGCLSVPEMRGVVPRAGRVGYRAWFPGGRRIEGEATGFQARILQHEVDHLNGLLYLDRMRDLSTLGYAQELGAAELRAAEPAAAR